MKDYKRLTDRDDDGIPYVKCADCYIRDKCDLTKEVCYQELKDRLAEIEDKIEAGTFVEVPKGAVVLTPEERAEEMRLCNEERKQLEHRAEVAERALLDMCRETAASRYFADKWQKYYKEQAEREIEEGKKDE